jgi:molybdopterin/thiamine biosynthesis adenylyltransferase
MGTHQRSSTTADRRNAFRGTPTAERLVGRFVEIECDDATGTGVGPRAAREARLPSFLGLSEPAGPRLDAYRAMLVGVGSVNGNVALHCGRLQIGELWLVDPGRLKPESLLTHPIEPSGVGIAKEEYFGRLVKAISPGTRVFAFPGPVQSLSLGALERVDVVAMAADNLAAEVETGQRCLHHGKPLVQASVHGDTLVAQARFWRNDDGTGP